MEALNPILAELEYGDVKARVLALIEMSKTPGVEWEAVEGQLTRILEDSESPAPQLLSAFMLAKLGSESDLVLAVLCNLNLDPSYGEGASLHYMLLSTAIKGLAHLKDRPEATAYLQEVAKANPWGLRTEVLYAMSWQARPEARPYLQYLAGKGDSEARRALERLNHPSSDLLSCTACANFSLSEEWGKTMFGKPRCPKCGESKGFTDAADYFGVVG